MAELLIRAGWTDCDRVLSVLAPGGAVPLRSPISRLVVDAHIAVVRPELGDGARAAGVAFVVDPLSYLLQGETDPTKSWVKHVPFADARAWMPQDFSDREIARLAEAAVEFQREHGATTIVPPYLFAQSPEDPAFSVSLRLLAATAGYMRRNSVYLGLMPLFCGTHAGFTSEVSWQDGVDRFVDHAADLGPQAIAFCFSPLGGPKDSYAKVSKYFLTAERFRRLGTPTIAWRQGVFGPGLVAAGAHGYETGVGTNERADVRSWITSSKPRPGAQTGGPTPKMLFLESLGRSVKLEVAEALLGDRSTRARVMCDDDLCCPDGVDSMLDHRERHAINARARRLANLGQMPRTSWRMHQAAQDARQVVETTRRARLVARREGVATEMPTIAQEALAQTMEYLQKRDEERRSA